jgi:2-hydroxychromene-2-carboxylate isomerase
MTKVVEFWFDYGSGSAHVAYWALKDVARRTGAEIDLRPMLLGAVFKATGNRTPMEVEAKGRWMVWDLQNYAQRYGMSFRMNPHFMINTLPLMRAALVAERWGELEPFSDAMFNAVWVEERDMGDSGVIRATIAEKGFDAGAYMDDIQEQGVKDELMHRSEQAVAKGIFGAPTFFVGENMWWGQDRLEWVEAALMGGDARNAKEKA